MTLSVCKENYIKLVDDAHLLYSYSDLILNDFNKKEIKLFNFLPYQRIFLFIFTRSIKTYSSILFLCEKGYGQDVSTLLRSLLENLITVKYILQQNNSDELAKRFVAYKWIIFSKSISDGQRKYQNADTEEKIFFEEKKRIIKKKVAEFKKLFNIRSDRALMTWSGITSRDMSKQIGLEWLEEYETTFRLCSRFSHPTILGDKEYIIQDDKHLIFSYLPSEIGIMPNLSRAMKYTLEFLKILNSLFNLNYAENLKQIENKIEQNVKLNKYEHVRQFSDEQTAKSTIRECIIKFKTQQYQSITA